MTPTPKDFSTMQARAALAGLELAQVPAAPDAEPAYRITSHAQQIDLTDWEQVVAFLKGASHG